MKAITNEKILKAVIVVIMWGILMVVCGMYKTMNMDPFWYTLTVVIWSIVLGLGTISLVGKVKEEG